MQFEGTRATPYTPLAFIGGWVFQEETRGDEQGSPAQKKPSFFFSCCCFHLAML